MDYIALKHLPSRIFGVLMRSEPVIEVLNIRAAIAVSSITNEFLLQIIKLRSLTDS
ncbi:MAG: hypothetical protein HC820_10230 [Hydrococcus sp. RM1_1_31]|nr:hypothetical protein [Hydrococcus sp. RM1_1_31]